MRARLSTSNSKKIIVSVTALVLLAVFYFALGELYEYAAGQNKINAYNKQRFDDFYAAEPNSIDWIFVGSSHAYCTFDPANFDVMGINTFQMGMPLQLLDGTYFTLTEILDYQQPDTVVLDLYWYVLEKEFDAKQMEMFFEVLRHNGTKRHYLTEVLPLNEKIKYYLKPVRYQADFFAYVNDKLLNVIAYRLGLRKTPTHGAGEEYYKGRGYVYYDYVMTETQYNTIRTQPMTDMWGWSIHPKQEKYLRKIVELCEERGIRLVLTTAPVSNVQFERLAHYDQFHEQIAAFAREYGLPYLDFNLVNEKTGLFDDDCFFDAGHLNDRGVRLADVYFMNWMLKEDMK